MERIQLVVERKDLENQQLEREIYADIRARTSHTARYFRRIVPTLDLSPQRKVIFVDRFVSAVEHLEQKRRGVRRAGAIGNSLVQIGSVLTPALLSITHLENAGGTGYVFWSTWATSLLTGIAATMLSLFKIQKKEIVYTEALSKLVSEGFRYVELSDRYKSKDLNGAHERHFSTFFTAVEAILLSETRVSGSHDEKKDTKEEKELNQLEQKS